MTIRLQELRLDQRELVAGITMDPGQEAFAGGTLDEVFNQIGKPPHGQIPFALFDKTEAVGFLIAREGAALPNWVGRGCMSLHNLRIDARAQGRGYGKAALRLAGQWIARIRPEVTQVMSSVNVRNVPALRLNLACGFAPTGEMIEGRIGRQIVLGVSVERLAAGQPASTSTRSL